jgi:hypothetical protein
MGGKRRTHRSSSAGLADGSDDGAAAGARGDGGGGAGGGGGGESSWWPLRKLRRAAKAPRTGEGPERRGKSGGGGGGGGGAAGADAEGRSVRRRAEYARALAAALQRPCVGLGAPVVLFLGPSAAAAAFGGAATAPLTPSAPAIETVLQPLGELQGPASPAHTHAGAGPSSWLFLQLPGFTADA